MPPAPTPPVLARAAETSERRATVARIAEVRLAAALADLQRAMAALAQETPFFDALVNRLREAADGVGDVARVLESVGGDEDEHGQG